MLKKMSTVSLRNIRSLIIVSLVTVVVSGAIIISPVLNAADIVKLGSDFQFDLINFSSILAGFLFTGIGILISAIDKERIKRLWNCHYLDNIYYCSAFGIFVNILNIISALAFVACSLTDKARRCIADIQIVLTMLGLVYFSWCALKLMKLISKMREE